MPVVERLVTRTKNLLFPPGKRARRMPAGLLKNLNFELDFKNQVQIYLGLSEQELIPWFERYTRGIHTAIDVGAAEGRYTLPLLARTSVKNVIACEPTERRQGLAANLRLNQLEGDPRLVVVPHFIGAQVTEEMRTLDSLLPSVQFPCLVKMDIEGAEAEALRGGEQLLGQADVSFIIETHSLALEEECAEILRDAGYEVTVITNARWRSFVPLPGLGPIGHSRWLAATNNPAHMSRQ